jgi:thiol-disulfide isomerase/thioredoxin
MWKKELNILKSAILIMIIGLAVNVTGQTVQTAEGLAPRQAENAKPGGPVIGKEAPTFSLPDLQQKYIALRDFCGPKLNKPWINKTKQVVVLSFFATYCKPCLQEIPHLEKIGNSFNGQPVKFLLVNVGEEEAKIKEFLSTNSIGLDILLDRYSKIAEKYDALSLPRLYVIDKEGIVRKEQKGFSDPVQFEVELTRLLNDLLK